MSSSSPSSAELLLLPALGWLLGSGTLVGLRCTSFVVCSTPAAGMAGALQAIWGAQRSLLRDCRVHRAEQIGQCTLMCVGACNHIKCSGGWQAAPG